MSPQKTIERALHIYKQECATMLLFDGKAMTQVKYMTDLDNGLPLQAT